jgi:succinate dehydrogenase/fumarate reductase-like Fe-S protein
MVSLVFRLNCRSGLCGMFDIALRAEEMLALE